MARVIFDFDYTEESSLIKMHQRCHEYWNNLNEIHELCTKMQTNHPKMDDVIFEFLEVIKEISSEIYD